MLSHFFGKEGYCHDNTTSVFYRHVAVNFLSLLAYLSFTAVPFLWLVVTGGPTWLMVETASLLTHSFARFTEDTVDLFDLLFS